MPHCYDAVVVGAGPAGSTAAGELARHGFSVLLLEGKILPRDKPCGGGLTPRALPHLSVPIDDLVLNSVTSVQVRVGASVSTRFHSRDEAIRMVRRRDFDMRLAEGAVRLGADLHDAEMVISVEPGPEIAVVTALGRYRARTLVAADGAESKVARWLGMPRPRRWMVALEDEVEVMGDPLRGEALVDLSVPYGYAWVFPKGDLYNIGLGTFDRRYAPELRPRFHSFAEGLGLKFERELAPVGHRIPAGLPDGPLHRGNALVVGDAAGVADPFFAEGISYALLSGRLAADAAAGYLAGQTQDLSSYTQRIRDTLRSDMRLFGVTAAVVHHLPALSLRMLAASGWLQRLVERTIAGEVSLSTFAGPHCLC